MAALPAQAEKANRILFFEQANRISVGKQQTTGQKGRHTEQRERMMLQLIETNLFVYEEWREQ